MRFNVDGFSEEARVRGLAAGANTAVCVTDLTLRNAGDSVWKQDRDDNGIFLFILVF